MYFLNPIRKFLRNQTIRNVVMGKNVKIWSNVNLYGCSLGDETTVGTFVEIQSGVKIGARCKISSHSFICEGVTIEDGVFIGHGVMFINDKRPRAVTSEGELENKNDWKDRFETTRICAGASIGSNATILSGITIGERSIIGAGSVVTKDVPNDTVVAGNPAKSLRG